MLQANGCKLTADGCQPAWGENMEDTIAAIATPPGEGGIGIIRISGSDAVRIIEQLFAPKNKKLWEQKTSHRLYLGHIVDKNKNQPIDEVLVSIMKSPKSFTGEDVVEINCHGGYLPLTLILELVLASGARLAGPGEFSKRAFLNGRLDLAQAEAIIDVIRATSQSGLTAAVNQLQGGLSKQVEKLRADLLRIIAYLEASIDFPEDEIEALSAQEITEVLTLVLNETHRMLEGFNAGKIYREGLKTVIVGKPNVGKSSLLNALVRENRAIVTEIPGTTRDVIEEIISFGGIALKIVDTAGIRETEDLVEKIGVEKSKALLMEADLVLVVLDAALGIDAADEEILQMVKQSGKKYLVLLNKIDVAKEKENKVLVEHDHILEISAKEEIGLDQLERTIKNLLLAGQIAPNSEKLVTRYRHYEALQRAERHVKETLSALKRNMPADFLSIDLKAAWEALGEITGSTVSEDILDRIFADFCIGK